MFRSLPFLQGSRRPRLSWTSSAHWIPILLFVFSWIYYLSYQDRFIQFVDEGLAVNGALRVLEGQIPLIDFYSYTPGRYYLLAGFFKLFGVTITSERLMWILIMSLRNVFAYGVASKLLPRGASLVITLPLLLVPGPWFKSIYSFSLFGHVLVLAFHLRARSTRSSILLGIFCGILFYLRYEFCLMAVVITIAAFVADAWLNRRQTPSIDGNGPTPAARSRPVKQVAGFLAGLLICLLPFLLLLFNSHSGLALERLFSIPPRAAGTFFEMMDVLPDLMEQTANLTTWAEKVGHFLQPWLLGFTIYSLAIGAAAFLVVLRRQLRAEAVKRTSLFLGGSLLLWTGGMFLRYYPFPLVRTFLFTSQTIWLLIAWSVYQMLDASRAIDEGRTLRLGRRSGFVRAGAKITALFSIALASMTLGLLMYYGLTGCEDCGAWKARSSDAVRLQLDRAPLVLDSVRADLLERLVDAVQNLTTPEEGIFAYRHSMLYFLTSRRNATKLDNMIPPIFSSREAQLLREDFLQNPPALQIYQITRSIPQKELFFQYPCELRTVMMDGYRYHEIIGNFLIMVRDPGSNGLEALKTGYQKRGMQFNLNKFSCSDTLP